MSDTDERAYPPGVPERQRRPSDNSVVAGMTALGALAGLGMSENLGGALLGGLLGAALSRNAPVLSLKEALGKALEAKGASLINLYRRGPYIAEVLFRYNDRYWTITSRAPQVAQWTQAALDDWLYGDLIDVQLPRILWGGVR